MCSCYAFAGMTHDTLSWKLFPFSLVEEARQWYTKNVESVNGSWSKLRDKLCHRFYPSPVSSLYERISFAFSQMRRKPQVQLGLDFQSQQNPALSCRYRIMQCFNTFSRDSTHNLPLVLMQALEGLFPRRLRSKEWKSQIVSPKTIPSYPSTNPPEKSVCQVMRILQQPNPIFHFPQPQIQLRILSGTSSEERRNSTSGTPF